MANFPPGTYRIVSLIEADKPPTSILPVPLPLQNVRLREPKQTWTFDPVGDNTYLLSIEGYPSTGIIDDKVIASVDPGINVKWHFTYRIDQDAYTIEPVDDQSKGWTIFGAISENPEIVIEPFISTTVFVPYQLFQVQGVDK